MVKLLDEIHPSEILKEITSRIRVFQPATA
jgi:hypothetical protein